MTSICAIIRVPSTFDVTNQETAESLEAAGVLIPYNLFPGTRTYYNKQLTLAVADSAAVLTPIGEVLAWQTYDGTDGKPVAAASLAPYWGAKATAADVRPGVMAGQAPWALT